MNNVTYTAQSGRVQILSDVAASADQLGGALALLGEVYEQLDEHSAELMEEQLFQPLQAAYGQLKRTHTEFAARHGLDRYDFAAAGVRLPEAARAGIEHAVDAVRSADATLANLQDSMLPVDVGDQELRAGLSRARTLLAPFPGQAAALIRTLGR